MLLILGSSAFLFAIFLLYYNVNLTVPLVKLYSILDQVEQNQIEIIPIRLQWPILKVFERHKNAQILYLDVFFEILQKLLDLVV